MTPITLKRSVLTLTALCIIGPLAFAHPHDTPKTSQVETPKVESKKVWPYFGKKSEPTSKTDIIEGADEDIIIIKKVRVKDGDNSTIELPHDLEKHFKHHADKMRIKIKRAEDQHEKAMQKFQRKFEKDTKDLSDPDALRDAAKNIEVLIAESGIFSNFADIIADFAEDIEVENNDKGLALKFDGKTLGKLKMENYNDDSFELEGLGRNLTIDKKVITKNGKTKTRIIIEMDGGEDIDLEFDRP